MDNAHGRLVIYLASLASLIGEDNVFPGQPQFGAALREALAAAEEWLAPGQDSGG
jgi:hypothetical protein